MRRLAFAVALCTLSVASSTDAATIRVPADQATIQAAINASSDGDTVLVSPGDYDEAINYSTHRIRVKCDSPNRDCTLGYASGSVNLVIIASGQDSTTTLEGFVLLDPTNGDPLWINGASPTIRNCEFRGGTVLSLMGHPTFDRNLFTNDATLVYSNPTGVRGYVLNNTSIDAGIWDVPGGGKVTFRGNLMIRSSWYGIAAGANDCEIINNTIVGCADAGIYVYNGTTGTQVRNNISAFNATYGIYYSAPGVIPDYNDVYGNMVGSYFGMLPGPGDLATDPLFFDQGMDNYELLAQSPCVDAGDPSPIYNDPDGSRSDIGAFPLSCGIEIDSADCDHDGIPNVEDNCKATDNPDQIDADADSIGDACDNCVNTANTNQADTDSDSRGDACDNCPTIANANQQDSDGDEKGDVCDNCPGDFNPSQTDTDGDGIGDICDACLFDPDNDADGDGICGNSDNCPGMANSNQADADLDGVGDVCDNCPSKFNPAQEETDGDGIADSCDNCPTVFNASQTDVDNDGIGNACDVCLTDPLNDSDADGVCHSVDNCPTVFNPDQADTNGNNIGDVCDCLCLCHGDPACDSVIANVVDVVNTIGVAFRGTAPFNDPSPTCPWESTDVDCSGSTNVVDVVKTVNVAFRGASAAAEYCEACD